MTEWYVSIFLPYAMLDFLFVWEVTKQGTGKSVRNKVRYKRQTSNSNMSTNQFTEDSYEQTLIDLFRRLAQTFQSMLE